MVHHLPILIIAFSLAACSAAQTSNGPSQSADDVPLSDEDTTDSTIRGLSLSISEDQGLHVSQRAGLWLRRNGDQWETARFNTRTGHHHHGASVNTFCQPYETLAHDRAQAIDELLDIIPVSEHEARGGSGNILFIVAREDGESRYRLNCPEALTASAEAAETRGPASDLCTMANRIFSLASEPAQQMSPPSPQPIEISNEEAEAIEAAESRRLENEACVFLP